MAPQTTTFCLVLQSRHLFAYASPWSASFVFACRCGRTLKAGLYRNANTNAACENDAYVYVGKFVDCSAFAEAANWPYINVLYANSLWCTNSRQITFGCSRNVRHTAECCLPRLRNTSTSNIRIVFACRIRVLFVFRCKCGLRIQIRKIILTTTQNVTVTRQMVWRAIWTVQSDCHRDSVSSHKPSISGVGYF